MSRLQELRARGFDLSAHVPFTRTWQPRCSCCVVLVINGTPTHEHRCPNATHECAGCNALVPARVRYCEDCAQ